MTTRAAGHQGSHQEEPRSPWPDLRRDGTVHGMICKLIRLHPVVYIAILMYEMAKEADHIEEYIATMASAYPDA